MAPLVGESGDSNSAGWLGSVPPEVLDGNEGARNDVPPLMTPLVLPPASQQPRVVDDLDKFTKDKEFLGGEDLIEAENWINNIEITFKAIQVLHGHRTRFVTCMLQEA